MNISYKTNILVNMHEYLWVLPLHADSDLYLKIDVRRRTISGSVLEKKGVGQETRVPFQS